MHAEAVRLKIKVGIHGLRDQEGVEETGPCVGAGTSGEWNKRTRLPCTGREGMRPGAKDTGAHLKSCSDKADGGGNHAQRTCCRY
jgi:hypothetical protein